MERNFYQTLRKIQKAERKATLSRVGDDFYKEMYSYIKELEHSIQNNPFSNEEHNLLKNSQIIATEICQSREKKICDSAFSNIQRSYFLFAKDRPQFDVVDTTPLNLTPEEETLYYALMDTLKEHRSRISLDKYGEENPADAYSLGDDSEDYPDSGDFDAVSSSSNLDDSSAYSADDEDDYDYSNEDPYIFAADGDSPADTQEDEVSKRFNQIKNAKVVSDEKYEPIEKQIANQKIAQAMDEDDFNSSFTAQNADAGVGEGFSEGQDVSEGFSSSQDVSDESFSVDADVDESFSSAQDVSEDFSSGQSESDSKDSDPLPKDDEMDFNPASLEEESYPDINPFSQEDEFNFPNPFDEQFSNDIRNSHEDDYNRVRADLNRINDDLDKLSSEIPTGRKEKIERIAVKINDKINSIIGVDEKIYGPFAPEDVVTLPKLNADILINKNKARQVDI